MALRSLFFMLGLWFLLYISEAKYVERCIEDWIGEAVAQLTAGDNHDWLISSLVIVHLRVLFIEPPANSSCLPLSPTSESSILDPLTTFLPDTRRIWTRLLRTTRSGTGRLMPKERRGREQLKLQRLRADRIHRWSGHQLLYETRK